MPKILKCGDRVVGKSAIARQRGGKVDSLIYEGIKKRYRVLWDNNEVGTYTSNALGVESTIPRSSGRQPSRSIVADEEFDNISESDDSDDGEEMSIEDGADDAVLDG